MTEAEWATSTDAHRMLRRCRRIIRYDPRKGFLFAVACGFRIWHLLADQRSRHAVETAAKYADGLASWAQLGAAEQAASAAHNDAFRAKGKLGACAEWAAQFAANFDAWFAASHASNFAYVAAGDGLDLGPEHTAQADLLRCVFGPLPFRSVTLDPSSLTWNDGTVVKLAQGIYDEQPFDRMPVLGDALEEAGCSNPDIVAHCRQSVEHVRGCHVIDLILGKSPLGLPDEMPATASR